MATRSLTSADACLREDLLIPSLPLKSKRESASRAHANPPKAASGQCPSQLSWRVERITHSALARLAPLFTQDQREPPSGISSVIQLSQCFNLLCAIVTCPRIPCQIPAGASTRSSKRARRPAR